MPSAIFIVPSTEAGPTLDLELIQDGTPGYGYSVIGQVPQAGTCLVRVWASEEALDTLTASEDVEFVEDVEEPSNGEN